MPSLLPKRLTIETRRDHYVTLILPRLSPDYFNRIRTPFSKLSSRATRFVQEVWDHEWVVAVLLPRSDKASADRHAPIPRSHRFSTSLARRAPPMAQRMRMTQAEPQRVDKLRASGHSAMNAMSLLNRSCALRGIAPVSRTAMYASALSPASCPT